MSEAVVFGLDVVQFVTSVSALVTAGCASFVAAKTRSVLSTIDANEERSQRNQRLLLGGEATRGLVDRVQHVERRRGGGGPGGA